MKKCANCGKENIDKAIFCANCGARLDSISKDSNSNDNSSPTPALDSIKRNMGNEKSVNSFNERLNSDSSYNKKANTGPNSDSSYNKKANTGPNSDSSNSNANGSRMNFKTCCCYVPIVLCILFLAVALIYHGSAESFPTGYGGDFEYLDLNGDGLLSYNEASQIDLSINSSQISKYFDESDTNSNGFLKGHEFDLFCDDIRYYRSSLEDSSSDSDKYKYSSSSNSKSTSSSHSHSSSRSSSSSSYEDEYDSSSEGYVLTCPYCGSEAIYETGGLYKCAECGSTIYSPDDLELAYYEGYMDLLLPVSLSIV